MNLENRSSFTDVDLAIEEAQFLVERHKIPHSIIKVKAYHEERLYVVPTEIVVEVFVLETFKPSEAEK